MVLVNMADCVEFAPHKGVLVLQKTLKITADDLAWMAVTALKHMEDELFTSAYKKNHRNEFYKVVVEKYGRFEVRISYQEFESLLKIARLNSITRSKKQELIKDRRQEFQRSRKYIMLAMIEDGHIYACNECHSSSDITIDHVVPLSRGGSDELENLQFLCRSCNSRKSAKVNSSA